MLPVLYHGGEIMLLSLDCREIPCPPGIRPPVSTLITLASSYAVVKARRGEMYCWQKVVQRELHRFGKSQNYNHLRSVGHTPCSGGSSERSSLHELSWS